MRTSPLNVASESVLSYTDATRGPCPIPAWERDLPTVTAEPYFKVSDEPLSLEGPAYDRDGNLLFLDIYGGRVLRLSTAGELSTLYSDPELCPAGIGIHRDGRIFLAAVGHFKAGSIVAIDPDGTNLQEIVSPKRGFLPDDLVFDRRGGFYLTDFSGTATAPTGGVHYVSPDFETITPVLPHMSGANGVALSPDEKVLWSTEFCASRLHRMDLLNSTTIRSVGSMVPYHFVGRAPDSMRTDANGNVYVAMYLQGRIMVFSPYGMPIGQILLPGRDTGCFLRSTSLAFVPGSSDVVIVARDDVGGQGSMVFRAGALTEGTRLFSHQ